MLDKIFDALSEIEFDWFHKLLMFSNIIALLFLPFMVEKSYELIAVKKYLLSQEIQQDDDKTYRELKVYADK